MKLDIVHKEALLNNDIKLYNLTGAALLSQKWKKPRFNTLYYSILHSKCNKYVALGQSFRGYFAIQYVNCRLFI